jgi:alpha-L-rhamnosidase
MFAISHLRCEYLVDPLGIDEPRPRLSWRLESKRRGTWQGAYRVLVASSPDLLVKEGEGAGDLWDSGQIQSDQSTHVAYGGKVLSSRERAFWKVTVWDELGKEATSEIAQWSTGLLEEGDWKAKWIGADPEIVRRDKEAIAPTLTECGTPGLFRKEFVLGGAVKRATVYASARGVFELRIDGKRVGEDLLAPEWTDYDKRIQYRTYDVTGLVAAGKNVIAATLGDGWWSGYVGWQEQRGRYGLLENSLLVQLEVELENGQKVTICSDGSWRCETGPILYSDFMMGETYDARQERMGWDRAGFDDGKWLGAREVAAPTAALVPQRGEPVRVTEVREPVSVKAIAKGVFIYDLGQNMTGWVRLFLRKATPAGTRVQIRHGERLSPDGTLYTENLRRAKATDVYITRGGSEEVYEPHFTFHGFQYVEITGLAQADEATVRGCVIHSATPAAGTFECSHAGVNRLWLNGVWSQRDNFLTVPTDCPQRDERLGWMGDAQVFSRTATYNMNVAAFFTKWMQDVEDGQTAEGIFPDVAPRLREDNHFVGLGGLCGAAGWADAGVIIPYTMWRVYGDQRLIERHWGAMTKWLDFLERENPNGLRLNKLGNNYGDWLCIPSDTSFGTHSPMKNLLATAYWANDARMMARMAAGLGREAEVQRFSAMYEKVKTAFQKEWSLPDGQLKVETQTAYLLALAFGLIPDGEREKAAERLVENIRNLDWHLSTGFIGISHLNPELTLSGHADVAYKLLLQETYPSWLYPVKHGATTIWERWNGWTHEDGFFNPQMNSFNHYSLGSVGEWLFRHVAGIELDPAVNGFKKFVLHPWLPRAETGLTFARARYETAHGEIVSDWRRNGDVLTWKIRVPANTTARAWVPSVEGGVVKESGGAVEKADGVRVIGRERKSLVVDLAAGEYGFESVYRD